jgi:PTH2 family peptidyl-tRNA hydrolase
MDQNFKQVIVIRKDLNMRKGKMVAQGAHASMAAILDIAKNVDSGLLIPKDDRYWFWLTGNFKKITVSVNSEQELLEIYELAKKANMLSSLILDSGKTEFHGQPTYTAVAVGPDRNENVDLITKNLPLL